MRRFGYQNAVLSVIALLLALGLIDRRTGGEVMQPATAAAQGPGDPDQGGLTNKLEQNKQIIAELRTINSRLERIDAKLNSGVSVKVTSMPAIQVNGGEKAKAKDESSAPPAPTAPAAPAPKKAN